ncbi:ornithine cyclodeaminase family protein [Elioraea rosea]|uniref:ornithine cyclodeaminase family protein n=1 Tax=Elioraea rosea TaxID=2492390 RepID=UPI001183C296|nr:ornithine cyclodeaminase family protein [Elioraea rosea]
MRVIDAAALAALTPYPALIEALAKGLQKPVASPPRGHLDPTGRGDALLLMPAWREGGLMGVKLVTAYPGNSARGIPAIAASYTAFEQATGEVLAVLDGTELTARRTAAAAALGARLLARIDARRLLVIGTGALSAPLARAHVAALPGLREITVWGRNQAKAADVAAALTAEGMAASPAFSLEEAVRAAEVIVAATTATEPMIREAWVREGTHLGLVGAFTATMAEAEPALLPRALVYADDREAVLAKGGEVVQAIAAGLIGPDAVLGDLALLLRGGDAPRPAAAITVFKSVGFAALDLIAAELALGRA